MKSRILLVDDEHDSNSIFTIGLPYAGFEVDAYNDTKFLKSLPQYDKEKYKEMILDAAQTVLGLFGFDRTVQ